MQVFFLIPVYNESLNLDLLFENLNKYESKRNKYFVFVDDHSKDDTVIKIKKLFAGYPLHIIEKTRNIGPGDSFNKGFEWILNQSKDDTDLIVTIEGDNTSDLNILSHMIAISELGYDLVLSSVYAQGGGFEKTTIMRKVISFVANMLFRALLNTKVLTLSSFYRVYSISLLKRIKSHNNVIIKEPGFICMLEILLKAIKQNAKIIEVPMILRSHNRNGKSKMKIFKNMISYLRFLPKARLIIK